MNAIYASLICVAGALLCAVVKPQRPELAVGIALSAGAAAAAVCLKDIRDAASFLGEISRMADGQEENVRIMLRALGITLIAEFASQVCADAGESALAGRIRLGLRFALMGMALPLIAEILQSALSLLG